MITPEGSMTLRNLIRILAGAITGATKLLIPSAKARPALIHNPLPKYVQATIDQGQKSVFNHGYPHDSLNERRAISLILHVNPEARQAILSEGLNGISKAARAHILQHFELPEDTPHIYVHRQLGNSTYPRIETFYAANPFGDKKPLLLTKGFV